TKAQSSCRRLEVLRLAALAQDFGRRLTLRSRLLNASSSSPPAGTTSLYCHVRSFPFLCNEFDKLTTFTVAAKILAIVRARYGGSIGSLCPLVVQPFASFDSRESMFFFIGHGSSWPCSKSVVAAKSIPRSFGTSSNTSHYS